MKPLVGEPPCLVCGSPTHGFLLYANGDLQCVTGTSRNLASRPLAIVAGEDAQGLYVDADLRVSAPSMATVEAVFSALGVRFRKLTISGALPPRLEGV